MPCARKSTWPSFAASSSNTSMNVAPMILRFCSGIGDAGQPIEKQRRRVDEHERQLQPLEALGGSARPRRAAARRCRRRCRSADRRSARWMRSAATVESTPPLSAQTTRPSPDLRADPRRRLLDERRHRPVAGAAADAVGEVAQDLEAVLGVRDLRDGTAARSSAAPRSAIAATGALALVATTVNPGGAAATKSPWLAQTRSSAGTAANSARARHRRRRCTMRVAELAVRRRRHAPAERVASSAACRSRCRAPARRASKHRRVAAAARRPPTRSSARPTG